MSDDVIDEGPLRPERWVESGPEAIIAAMRRIAEDYQARYTDLPEPKPLLVPKWVVLAAEAFGEDLDETARRYGFDGYETFQEPLRNPSRRPPLF